MCVTPRAPRTVVKICIGEHQPIGYLQFVGITYNSQERRKFLSTDKPFQQEQHDSYSKLPAIISARLAFQPVL